MLGKAIYTTNAIVSLNASVRIRSRGQFTSVSATKKLLYLALWEASANWQSPLQFWSEAKREFALHFGDQFNPSRGWISTWNATIEFNFNVIQKNKVRSYTEFMTLPRAQAQSMIFDYVEGFYNPRRLHSALEYLSPVAYEARYFSAAERHGSSWCQPWTRPSPRLWIRHPDKLYRVSANMWQLQILEMILTGILIDQQYR